jgi:hypothetical protein
VTTEIDRVASPEPDGDRAGDGAAAADPVWAPPAPIGYPASVQALGGLAAPLLAAACFTMTALLLPSLTGADQRFARWPDVSLALFVASGLAHVAAVQAALWARRYDTGPDELIAWYPDRMRDGRPDEWLRAVQRSHLLLSERWATKARAAYHVGIVLLLAGMTVVMVPPAPMTWSRWLLVGTSGVGLVGEALWIVWAGFLDRQRRARAVAAGAVAVGSVVAAGVAVATVGSARAPAVVGAVIAAVAHGLFGLFSARHRWRFVHVGVGVGVATAAVVLAVWETLAVRLVLGGVLLACAGVAVYQLVREWSVERSAGAASGTGS